MATYPESGAERLYVSSTLNCCLPVPLVHSMFSIVQASSSLAWTVPDSLDDGANVMKFFPIDAVVSYLPVL